MASEIITRAQARAQGLKRYFTGLPCSRGHVAERQVCNLTCLECDREKHRAAYDPEKNRENGRRWREANREKVAADSAAYGRSPQAKAYKAAYYQANKGRISERRKARYAEQREVAVEYSRAWVQANPERAREAFRMAASRRRARKRSAGGHHTSADLKEIFEAQKGRCAYCAADLNKVPKEVDHIVPLAKGGSDGRSNIQWACRACNQSKNARDPIDFAQSLGLLL